MHKGRIPVISLLGLAMGYAGATGILVPPPSARAARSTAPIRYILRLNDAPLATYSGGIPGLAATVPRAAGARVLDTRSARSRMYLDYLNARQTRVLATMAQTLGHPVPVRFRFRYAFNGFAVRLTRAEATRIASLPGVRSVHPDVAFRPASATVSIPAAAADTDGSRAWIGSESVWSDATYATPGGAQDTEGEGIVVADLDTGINALNSSFAAQGLDGFAIVNPLGSGRFLGVCNAANTVLLQPDTYDSSFTCNDKLIGAYTYTRYFSSPSNDPDSPHDSEGHGSHTASTIAGDFTRATINGITLPLSGVAPHANIIAYDVCDPTDLCYESNSVAAIDQAIQDQSTLKAADPAGFKGMVMNFSIGGSDDPYNDPVDYAFLAAESAGIYISAAAGNGGPGSSTAAADRYPVSHLAPWIATVGAATYDSVYINSLQGFSGGSGAPSGALTGTGFTQGYGPAQIVYAGDYPYTSAEDPAPTHSLQQDAAECLQTFAASTFPSGAIVVCDRGDIARVQKATNAEAGGAGGFVLANAAANGTDLENDAYVIPGVQLTYADGQTLEAWISANAGSTLSATITGASTQSDSSAADQVAWFSSRGPVNSVYDDVLKPDLIAPGVNVLAAYDDPAYDYLSPSGTASAPENFIFLDGTSMATPHDTGAAALLKELHPAWDPMEIKSALMSTAVTATVGDQCAVSGVCTQTTSSTPSPHVRGAGRIDVQAASRAGFVLDESQADFNNAYPGAGGDLTALNLASLANDKCINSCTWTRTLSATQGSATLDYTVTVPAWMTVTDGTAPAATSTSFALAPGATVTLTFTADTATLPSNAWNYGEVDFTSSSSEDDGNPPPDAHFPLAVYVQPAAAEMRIAPGELAQSLTVNGSTATQQFVISNGGQLALNWSAVNVLGTAGLTHSTATPLPSASGALSTADGPIVSHPFDGLAGNLSDVFNLNGHGVYSADAFSMAISGSVLTISTPGFMIGGGTGGSLADATAITWYIYADNNGQPAGNPEDGLNDYDWSFSAAPTATGVDTSNATISLDVTAAGAPALQLKPGTYWLVVVPSFNSDIHQSNAEFWVWGFYKEQEGTAKIIDPYDLTGLNNFVWINNISSGIDHASMAFTLTGTYDCSGNSIPGVSMIPGSGTVAAGASQNVLVTFDPSGLSAGISTGGLCITGNDPATPFVILPVTETINANAPIVNSEQATVMTPTDVTVSATVLPGGDAATASVNYGTSAGTLDRSLTAGAISGTTAQTVRVPISGLSCGTNYFYQVTVINSAGTGSGNVDTFTTQACPVPQIISENVADIAQNSARFSATITPNGASGSVLFRFGLSNASLTRDTALQSFGSSGTLTLSSPATGLQCGTRYSFQAVVTYAQGTVPGTVVPFTTAACPPPSGGPTGGSGNPSGGGGDDDPGTLLVLLISIFWAIKPRVRTTR